MNPLRVTPLQTDIIWEDKQENLRRLQTILKQLRGKTEILILPETFSTGFSMNSCGLAEPVAGETITTLRQWASEYQIAIAGSYIACDEDTPQLAIDPLIKETHYYNRAFFLTPEGEESFYDKHHLFRMGSESVHFTPGNQRPIINYRGWNILLLVCYDLRFPVWSRNIDNEYDLLIYVGNWPESRRKVWDVLLQARALENMSYVCGVNRIGTDGNDLLYNGGTIVYSPKGEELACIGDDQEGFTTATLDQNSLTQFRNKFPAWKDADQFNLIN